MGTMQELGIAHTQFMENVLVDCSHFHEVTDCSRPEGEGANVESVY